MITLLAKDFKLLFGKDKSLVRKILTTLISFFFITCFIVIEVYLFTTILKKIEHFHQASSAFISLFLFIISIIVMISGIFRAYKLFFNEKDIEQLSSHPVSNSAIILSKLLFLFITHYGLSFMFVYPLFVSYGVLNDFGIRFYYLGLFYPILSFFFEVGVALILVYPFWFIKKYLKKRIIVNFIINLVILIAGCFLYSKVLNLFIEIIAGNNINSLFTKDRIDFLISLKQYQFPTNFLTNIFINKNFSLVIPYLCITLGVFILGLSIVIFAYHYVRNVSIVEKNRKLKEELKVSKVKVALIKKEILLLTKNADYTFSFTGLLIVQPFLAYLVIKALNTIFTTGVFSYYISILPNFIVLMDLLVLMLFSLIISQGANSYIQMEKNTIKMMKTLPVKASTQLLIKVSIPYVLSFLSLFITLVTLVVSGVITIWVFIFGIILGGSALLVYDIISLKEELMIRNHKPRSSFVSNLFTYFLPIGFFIVSLIISYVGVSMFFSFLIGLAVIVLAGTPFVIHLKKNLSNLFMELDVIN